MSEIHPIIRFLHNKRLRTNMGTGTLRVVGRVSVEDWEKGKTTPQLRNLAKLARAFGYEVSLRRLECCWKPNHVPGKCLCECHPSK